MKNIYRPYEYKISWFDIFKISVGKITNVKYRLMPADVSVYHLVRAGTILRKISWERWSVPLLDKAVSPSSSTGWHDRRRAFGEERNTGAGRPSRRQRNEERETRWRIRVSKVSSRNSRGRGRRGGGGGPRSRERASRDPSRASPITAPILRQTREYNFLRNSHRGCVYSPWTPRRSRRPTPRGIPR